MTKNRLASQSFTNTSGAYTKCFNRRFYYHGTNNSLDRIVDPSGSPTRLFNTTGTNGGSARRLAQPLDALRVRQPGLPRHPHHRRRRLLQHETFDRKGRIVAKADPLGNTPIHLQYTRAAHEHHRTAGWITCSATTVAAT